MDVTSLLSALAPLETSYGSDATTFVSFLMSLVVNRPSSPRSASRPLTAPFTIVGEIVQPDLVRIFLKLIPTLEIDQQKTLFGTFLDLCNCPLYGYVNRFLCCDVGLPQTQLELHEYDGCKDTLTATLMCTSCDVGTMRKVMTLILKTRNKSDITNLVELLQRAYTTCLSNPMRTFIHLRGDNSSICSLGVMPFPKSGFSFYAELRVPWFAASQAAQDNPVLAGRNIMAFVTGDTTLFHFPPLFAVYAVPQSPTTFCLAYQVRKDAQGTSVATQVVSSIHFQFGKWYKIVLLYKYAFISSSTVTLLVDGMVSHTANLKYPPTMMGKFTFGCSVIPNCPPLALQIAHVCAFRECLEKEVLVNLTWNNLTYANLLFSYDARRCIGNVLKDLSLDVNFTRQQAANDAVISGGIRYAQKHFLETAMAVGSFHVWMFLLDHVCKEGMSETIGLFLKLTLHVLLSDPLSRSRQWLGEDGGCEIVARSLLAIPGGLLTSDITAAILFFRTHPEMTGDLKVVYYRELATNIRLWAHSDASVQREVLSPIVDAIQNAAERMWYSDMVQWSSFLDAAVQCWIQRETDTTVRGCVHMMTHIVQTLAEAQDALPKYIIRLLEILHAQEFLSSGIRQHLLSTVGILLHTHASLRQMGSEVGNFLITTQTASNPSIIQAVLQAAIQLLPDVPLQCCAPLLTSIGYHRRIVDLLAAHVHVSVAVVQLLFCFMSPSITPVMQDRVHVLEAVKNALQRSHGIVHEVGLLWGSPLWQSYVWALTPSETESCEASVRTEILNAACDICGLFLTALLEMENISSIIRNTWKLVTSQSHRKHLVGVMLERLATMQTVQVSTFNELMHQVILCEGDEHMVDLLIRAQGKGWLVFSKGINLFDFAAISLMEIMFMSQRLSFLETKSEALSSLRGPAEGVFERLRLYVTEKHTETVVLAKSITLKLKSLLLNFGKLVSDMVQSSEVAPHHVSFFLLELVTAHNKGFLPKKLFEATLQQIVAKHYPCLKDFRNAYCGDSVDYMTMKVFPEKVAAERKTADSANNDYRARVMAMYQKYQPDKLATVDALLAKAVGEEDLVIKRLVDKYGPEPAQIHDYMENTEVEIALLISSLAENCLANDWGSTFRHGWEISRSIQQTAHEVSNLNTASDILVLRQNHQSIYTAEAGALLFKITQDSEYIGFKERQRWSTFTEEFERTQFRLTKKHEKLCAQGADALVAESWPKQHMWKLDSFVTLNTSQLCYRVRRTIKGLNTTKIVAKTQLSVEQLSEPLLSRLAQSCDNDDVGGSSPPPEEKERGSLASGREPSPGLRSRATSSFEATSFEENIIKEGHNYQTEVAGKSSNELFVTPTEIQSITHSRAGYLHIHKAFIYFIDARNSSHNALRDYKIDLTTIEGIYPRRYCLQTNSLEICVQDPVRALRLFLRFDSENTMLKVSDIITSQIQTYRSHIGMSLINVMRALSTKRTAPASQRFAKSNITADWVNRRITNFEYLMHLNTMSNRTLCDVDQYPVFPWVLCDYSSHTLDLSSPTVYRDFSKPIAAQDPTQVEKFLLRYDNMEVGGTIPKFHYGTHYSNGTGVIYYLVRLKPFSDLLWKLQGGAWDVPDRMFHSIAESYHNVTHSTADVKELIPEFFYLPEFLLNLNGFQFGKRQTDAKELGDVLLPPWARNAYDFISQHREALESEYVSQNLHHWIDLIFGYKQKGPEAVKAINVYYFLTYEGAVDWAKITDIVEQNSLQQQICCWGQCPSQLLMKPHPQRAYPTRQSSHAPAPLLVSTVQLDSAQLPYLMTCFDGNLYLLHTPWHVTSFKIDAAQGTLHYSATHAFPGGAGPVNNPMYWTNAIAFLPRPSSLVSGMWLDGYVLKMFKLTKDQVNCKITGSFSAQVRAVSVSSCGRYVVSGGEDSVVRVYAIQQQRKSLFHLHNLYGHSKAVNAVIVSSEMDLVVSGSDESFLLLFCLRKGKLLRRVDTPGSCTRLVGFFETPQCTFFSCTDTAVLCYSINGTSVLWKLGPMIDPISAVWADPAKSILAIATASRVAIIHVQRTPITLCTITVPVPVTSVYVHVENRQVFIGGVNASVYFYRY